jgi:hypothetical protein
MDLLPSPSIGLFGNLIGWQRNCSNACPSPFLIPPAPPMSMIPAPLHSFPSGSCHPGFWLKRRSLRGLFILVCFSGLVPGPSGAAGNSPAMKRTQTVSLTAGWNAVFLEVEPRDTGVRDKIVTTCG